MPSSRTLNISAGNLTVNGIVTGTNASLTKNGSGTLILSGSNSYTGNTTISGGMLQFARDWSLYTATTANWTAAKIKVSSGGTLGLNVGGSQEFTTTQVTTLLNNVLGGGGFAAGSNLALDTTNAAGGTFTLADNIGNSIGLKKLGSNTLIITGANSYTGTTTIEAGTLQLGNGGTVGSLSTGSAITNNGTLLFNRSDTVTQGSTFSSNGITGTGNLTKNGTGTLVLNAANTYNGSTTLNAGTLVINNNGAIGNGTLIINGGTIDNTSGSAKTLTNNNTQTWATSFTFAATNGNLDLGSGNVSLTTSPTITVNAGNLTVGGNVTGGYSLTKAGSGNLSLTGLSFYTGSTTVNGTGTLSINSMANYGTASSIGSGGGLVMGGGTLIYTGGNSVSNRSLQFSTATSSIISIANSTTTLNMSATTTSGAGNFLYNGTGRLDLSMGHTGTTTISSGTLGYFGGSGATGAITLNGTATLLLNNSSYLSNKILNVYGGTTINNAGSNGLTFNPDGTPNSAINIYGDTTFSGSDLTLGTYTHNSANNLSVVLKNSGQTKLTVNSGNLTIGASITQQGVVATLVKEGNGTLSLLNLYNGWSGGTIINSGTLAVHRISYIGQAQSIGATGVTLGNATLRYYGSESLNYGAPSGWSNNPYGISNGATATIDVVEDFKILNLSGANPSSTGALIKTGNGTLVLSTPNYYTGGTTINGGRLMVETSNFIGSTTGSIQGNTTVNSGGTIGGNAQINGNLTLNSGAFIAPGARYGAGATNTPMIGNLTLSSGNMRWNGGAGYVWQISSATGNAGTDWDYINSTSSSLTVNASESNKFKIFVSQLNLSNFNYSSNYTWSIGTFSSITGFRKKYFDVITSASGDSAGISGFSGAYASSAYPNIPRFVVSQNGTSIELKYRDQAKVWNTSSGNWSTGAQWVNSVLPLEDDFISFTGNGGISNNNLVSSIYGLYFSTNASGSYTLTGNSLKTDVGGIINHSSLLQTISLNMTLDNDMSFQANAGNLTANGSINLNDNTLTATGGYLTSLLGTISGNGNLAVSGGTLLINGTNTFNGSTTINGGTLSLSSIGNASVAGPLGVNSNNATNLVFGGGTLLYTGANASTDRNFTLSNATSSTINVSSSTASSDILTFGRRAPLSRKAV